MADPSVSNIYENAAASLGNLLSGDVGGAFRTLTRPTTASPTERQPWVDRLLGPQTGLWGGFLHTVTNPLVLAGLAVSLRYPIATADRMMQFGSKIAGYARRQFPGMLQLQDFHETFRGTPLPDFFDYIVRANHTWKDSYGASFTRALETYEKQAGKPFDRVTGHRISVYLDGLTRKDNPLWENLERVIPEAKGAIERAIPRVELTAAEHELAQSFRGYMYSQYDRVRKGIAATKVKQDVGKMSKELLSQGIDIRPMTPGYTDSYLPHVESVSKETSRRQFEEWQAALTPEARRRIAENLPLRQKSKQLLPRTSWMLPNEDHLEAAGMMTPELKEIYKKLGQLKDEGVDVPWRRYSLDLLRTAENYTRGMARTYAWAAAPPHGGNQSMGQRIVAELPIMRQAGTMGKIRASMLTETYIPLAAGRLTPEQTLSSLRWSGTKQWAAEWIQKLPLDKGLKERLTAPLISDASLSWQDLGAKIQSYFYGSTLNFNLTSALKNTMQTVLTTVPVIGPKYTVEGISETARRAVRYTDLRQRGVSSGKAFQEAFREFAETAFDVRDPAYEEFVRIVDQDIGAIKLPSRVGKVGRWVKEKGFLPFQLTERFNRLTAFYGGRAKAMKELEGTRQLNPFTQEIDHLTRESGNLDAYATHFGDQVARMTQFGGGPLATPYFMLRGTQSWGPIRQYTQFPLRMLGLALGPGLRLGGGGGLNPGTLARMAMVSGLAYGAGKELLDTDLSGALLSGTLPVPTGGRLPLVSPFLQVAGTGIRAVFGDTEDLTEVLPLLVPGGIAASRAVGLIPGLSGAGKLVGKPYADYESRTPDGRIPVYSAAGALQGYFSPTQIFARAVGIGDVSGAKEIALQRYLLGQRDRLREFHRNAIEAIAEGDMKSYEQINKNFKAAYPGLGDIPIKRDDIRAVQLRREVPRLERVFETLPVEMRPVFAGVVSASLGAEAPGFLGVDPQLFAQSTIKQRHGARPVRPSPAGLPFGIQSGTSGESANLRAVLQQIGENRRDDEAGRGFNALEGY